MTLDPHPTPSPGSTSFEDGGSLPSMSSDRLWWLVIGLAFVPLFPVVFRAPMSLDYWLFLAKGERLWELGWSGFLPSNPFIFTAPKGSVYIDHEWLYSVLVRRFWEIFGHPGMVVARAAVIFAWCVFFFAICRRLGASLWLSLGVFGFGAYSVLVGRMSIRPHLLSYLFFLILFWAVLEPPRRRTLVGIGILFVFWANLHGGFVMAGVSLGVIGVWAIVAPLWYQKRDPALAAYIARWRAWWKLLLLLPALVCINPYGWHLWVILWNYQYEVSGLPDPLIAPEWRSFSLDDLYSQFFLVLAFSVLVTWFVPGRRLRSQWLLWIAVAIGFALSNARFIGLGFLLLGPLLASHLSLLQRPLLRAVLPLALGASCLLLIAQLWAFGSPYRFRPDLSLHPHHPLEVLRRHPQTQVRLFCDLNVVGYVAFRAYRHVRVAFDASPVTLFIGWSREYKAALLRTDAWEAYCRKYRCSAVLVDLSVAFYAPLASHLAASDDWRPLYMSLDWALYVRRDGESPAFAKEGYRALRPGFDQPSSQLRRISPQLLSPEIALLATRPEGKPLSLFIQTVLQAEAMGLSSLSSRSAPLSVEQKQRLAPIFDALLSLRKLAPWHPGIAYWLGLAWRAYGDQPRASALFQQAHAWDARFPRP